MPHFIVEYSANLEQAIDIPGLVCVVHQAAIATGVFPLKGTRTRACRRDVYCIADEAPENAFIHIQASVGHGRNVAIRRDAAETIFQAVAGYIQEFAAANPLALSFDMSEIDPATSIKLNNLPQWIAAREAETNNES